ncbi:alternative oxidase [Colletotrichum musicola]|uniref:Alternative oxidase n=1 Tax=Colletotrichum musicola TaxID=2175873 RepID=A0A8H6NPA6_9PEZI|nr:alternative oxidase [Colletotrichum musicola]
MAVLEVDAPAKGPSIFQRRHNLSFSQALSITVLLLLVLTLFALSTEEIRLSSIYNSEHHVTHAAPGDELHGGGAPPAEPEPYAPEADEPPVSYSQEDILQELSNKKITGEDTGAELATLCSKGDRKWNSNIIIECPVLNGGFGNVRLNILQCLRYVIEAKVSVKLPTISRRNADDITQFATSDQVELDYMIDTHNLVRTLGKHCPELAVHMSDYTDSRIRRLPEISPVLDLHIDSHLQGGMPADFSVPTAPEQWPPALDKWLEEKTEGKPAGPGSPVAFSLRAIMFAWPTSYDPPALVRHFSELVRPREEVKILAASALQHMQEKFGTHIDFRSRDKPRVHEDAFLGVHLRVEKDASDYHWLSYEDQISYVTHRLKNRKGNDTSPPDVDLPDTDKTVIYVASGDKPGIARLTSDVKPAKVVTKYDLLPEGTFVGTSLRNMTWDQQALVDMLILEHAGYFIGVRDSTFSWHLALRRAAAVNWIIGGYPEDCWLDDKKKRRSGCRELLAENEEWRDDLSTLVGNGHNRVEPQVAKVVWP